MTRADIISIVKTKLDEFTPFSEELVVSPSNSLVKPIEAHIDQFLDHETIEDLILQAPLQTLSFDAIPDDNITVSDGVATIVIPSDYTRLGMIQFALWERPVTTVIAELDPQAKLQLNKYTRARYAKPVVVLVGESDGKKLRCYSTPDKTGAVATYVKTPALESIPNRLIPAFTWLVASKVYFTLNMLKEAEGCDTFFKNSLMIRGIV